MLVVLVVGAATAAAETVQLLAGGRAVDAVAGSDRPGAQTRRLLVVGAAGLVAIAGKSATAALQAPLSQAAHRRAEGRILDVVAGLELAGSSDLALVPLDLAAAVPRWLLTRNALDPMAAMRGRSRGGRETFMQREYLTGGSAAHELRVFGATSFLRTRYDDLVAQDAAVMDATSRTNARRSLLASLAFRAAEAPAADRLLVRVTRRRSSVADAVTGALTARRTTGGFQRTLDSVNQLRRNASLASDYNTFVAVAPTPTVPTAATLPPPDFRRITVENVHFTYRGGERPVLSGVDLEIRQGEVVALVGENGSGKTTLAKILCHLYEPTSGTVRWDGIDIGLCDPSAVRSRVAAVFQDFARYPSFTAAQNIGIGLPALMDDAPAIVEAARRAGAQDPISALPQGYDTVLSRRFGGVDLSMGQWQRVALARAFLRDAPLVVLDEPTAALDPRAERDLFQTVASLYRSRSAILISHRLSSVRFADCICVLAGGRIIESGTHEELLDASATYAELFELQARAYR